MEEELNLFDFGTNSNGEYVNLTEEEQRLKDISEKDFLKWVETHENPLIRIAFDCFISSTEIEFGIHNDIKAKLEKIVLTKCYHYGNLEKGLYIFSINNEGRHMIVFENPNHYLVNEPSSWKLEHKTYGNVVDIDFDDYLLGKETIVFPALYCPCYDLKGNRIHKYADQDHYKEDIRHIVCIQEWEMNKFGKNRMHEGKKIKDFYEVEFTLPEIMEHWGNMNEQTL